MREDTRDISPAEIQQNDIVRYIGIGGKGELNASLNSPAVSLGRLNKDKWYRVLKVSYASAMRLAVVKNYNNYPPRLTVIDIYANFQFKSFEANKIKFPDSGGISSIRLVKVEDSYFLDFKIHDWCDGESYTLVIMSSYGIESVSDVKVHQDGSVIKEVKVE